MRETIEMKNIPMGVESNGLWKVGSYLVTRVGDEMNKKNMLLETVTDLVVVVVESCISVWKGG